MRTTRAAKMMAHAIHSPLGLVRISIHNLNPNGPLSNIGLGTGWQDGKGELNPIFSGWELFTTETRRTQRLIAKNPSLFLRPSVRRIGIVTEANEENEVVDLDVAGVDGNWWLEAGGVTGQCCCGS